MDRGAWPAIVSGVAESQTQLSTHNTQTKPVKYLRTLCSIKVCVHTFRNDLHIILQSGYLFWVIIWYIHTHTYVHMFVLFVTHPTRGDIAIKKTRSQVPSWNKLVLYFVIRYLRNGQSDFNYVWEMRDKEGEIGWQGKDVHL